MVPLSYAQRRLWFLSRLEGGSATYNMAMPLRLRGTLDREALRAAVRDVVARHESLRTLVAETDGEPWQRILGPAEAEPGIEVVPVADEDRLAAAVAAEAAHVFDLTAGLPLRVRLFALSEHDHVLLMVVHHIACDGWSVDPLVRDLSLAYTARHAGRAPDWEELPVQYADYALWQRELLGDEDDPDSVAARQLAYWREHLSGAPDRLPLPADRPRPAVATHRGGTASFRVDTDLHQRLAAVARQSGASVFMVVQAAFAALLTRMGAGHDIPVGVPVAGRTDEALDDLVGFFVNTLVLRTDTSGDPEFTDVLTRVRDTNLSAYEHQDLPFERLVEVLNPVRSAAHQPLFQVMVSHQSGTDAPLSLPGLDVGTEKVPSTTAKFDLCLTVDERFAADGTPAGLDGGLEYALDLFDPATAEDLALRFVLLLRAVAADPRVRIGAADLLTPEERQRITGEWAADPAALDTWQRHARTPLTERTGQERLYVLDEELRPVPPGAPGTVYVTHPGAAAAPDAVPCPFGDGTAAMVPTGDLARWAADGRLVPLGRAAGDVALGAMRIAPGEIETELAGHPAVGAAAVAVREDRAGQQHLLAWAEPAPGGTADPGALRDHLAAALPPYLVPTGVVVLDALPRTAGGDVDHAALPGPDGEETPGTGGAAQHTAALCEIFSEVLGVDDIEPDENFFDLGGHSLLAMRMISRIRGVFGTEVSIQTVFEAPTPELLAARLADGGTAAPFRPLLPLRTTGTRAPLFCVHPGAGIGWAYSALLRHLDPDRPVHALQARRLDGTGELPATVGEMARDYVRQIREVQPHGPYHLLGWSFGGVVAHEMAVLLQEEGEHTSTLAVLDAYPADPAGEPEPVEIGEQEVLATIVDFFGHDATAFDGPLTHEDVNKVLEAEGTGFPGLTARHVTAIAEVQTNNVNLLHAHAPRRFDGEMVFFTATDDDLGVVDEWRPFTAGPVHHHEVPCAHKDMMRPGPAGAIGRTVAEWLDGRD
ncbi:hypothetical protein GCM10010218_58540 [Streptomyces mashuensis]|uniref:Carrier domain-containing protein n=2 Tax=Streptomyces mashuensis TaxID=33904 RepID=A0A919EF29_9ACTN|nr:hypothetical protein GCM10010218_58540 [Streptomyces mashuensis]